jgi:hypothetical protein
MPGTRCPRAIPVSAAVCGLSFVALVYRLETDTVVAGVRFPVIVFAGDDLLRDAFRKRITRQV